MEYRNLHGTDIDLSAVAFGSVTFAASADRPEIDTEEGKRALHLALDQGVNCIHTSYEYKTRYAVREVLGERNATKKVHHIAKIPCPDFNFGRQWDPQIMTRHVEDALSEMDADRIDIVHWILRDDTVHDPKQSIAALNAIKDDVKATFDKLRDQGKVAHLTAFAYTHEFATAAAQTGIFPAVVFYYNIYDTSFLPCLDAVQKQGMNVITFRPLHSGLLTEKRRNVETLPSADKWMQSEHGRQTLQNRDELLKNAGISPEDLTVFALKFSLSLPLTATVVSGMNTREQVRHVLSAVDDDYPAAELAQRVYQETAKLGGPWE
jgi:aryl-alcohol dehydrogenase-like predicted oxidoreductase